MGLTCKELVGARFQLCRNQILQENTRWKALAEIYKCTPLQNQPPDLFAAEESKTVENCFCLKIAKHVANFLPNPAKFCQNFGKIVSDLENNEL